jgi:hypothetical protein
MDRTVQSPRELPESWHFAEAIVSYVPANVDEPRSASVRAGAGPDVGEDGIMADTDGMV